MARKIKPLIERFNEKYEIDPITNCWNWTASKWAKGRYGKIHTTKERGDVSAHRVSYELHHGDIPDGYEILHSCDNTLCVNPDHLSAGTHQDNMDDMVEKKRFGRGEKHNQAKISDKQIEEMINLRKNGTMVKDIAKKYNIDTGHTSRVTRGMRKKTN